MTDVQTVAQTIGVWAPGRHGDVPSLEADVSRAGDPATILFIGDLHLDNPRARRPELRRVLDEAVARDAAIVMIGDTFDVMQGRNDRRANKAALAAQYLGRDDYLNAVLEDVTAFLTPYANNVWMILHGNHETSVAKHYEVDLVPMLARALGPHVVTPGWQTYVAIRTRSGGKWNMTTYGFVTHGAGGNSPVTKGVIGAARRAVTYPDAAFIVSGHLHTEFTIAHPQHRVTQSGRVHNTKQRHVQVSAWKIEDSNRPSWANEKGFPPTLPSAYWCEFYRARGDNPPQRYQHRFVEAEP